MQNVRKSQYRAIKRSARAGAMTVEGGSWGEVPINLPGHVGKEMVQHVSANLQSIPVE